jgi:gamma-glutamylcyclotransferase (GGCT)/AIG2-like uncharacterized protein YtfP
MPDGGEVDLFVYGTLVPGGRYYDEVARWVVAHRPARVTGRLYDTGFGYPAARFDTSNTGVVRGVVLTLRDAAVALARLDEFEGPEYERVDVRTESGEVVATYQWRDAAPALAPVDAGVWPLP